MLLSLVGQPDSDFIALKNEDLNYEQSLELAVSALSSNERDLVAAEKYMRNAIRSAPGSSQSVHCLFHLGCILEDQGRLELAITPFEDALALEPTHLETLINLGGVYYSLNRFSEAVTYYERALVVNATNSVVHYNLANSLLQLGSVERAVACYELCLQLNPRDTGAMSNLATAVLYRSPRRSVGECSPSLPCFSPCFFPLLLPSMHRCKQSICTTLPLSIVCGSRPL
jgi:tetratricopeptide (TPR) repeat protein